MSLAIQQRAEHIAGTLPPLLAAAERIAANVTPGGHGRRRVGPGDAFWQYRRYDHGDPVQRIDWRRSAKGDHLFVREREWEAAQSVWLWCDQSPSSRYASHRTLPEKADRNAILGLALAALLVRGDERIGLLSDDDGPGLRAASGRAALNRLAEAMLSRRGEAKASLPHADAVPRHAHVVLIGDLLAPLQETETVVQQLLSRRTKGHLVHVLDPAETSLPFTGRTRFEGMEAEGSLLIRRSEAIRDDYRGRLDSHIAGLRDLARRTGWTYNLHVTDGSPESALLSLYMAIAG